MRTAAISSPPARGAYSRPVRPSQSDWRPLRGSRSNRPVPVPPAGGSGRSRRSRPPGRRPRTGLSGGLHPRQRRVAVDVRRAAPSRRTQTACPRTACGSPPRRRAPALVAAAPGARAQVGIQVGGRGNTARKGAGAGVEQHRLGRGEHVEARRQPGHLAGVGHVAGGILQPDDAAAERVEQPFDQRDMPVQAGLLRVVVEIDRDRLLRVALTMVSM